MSISDSRQPEQVLYIKTRLKTRLRTTPSATQRSELMSLIELWARANNLPSDEIIVYYSEDPS